MVGLRKMPGEDVELANGYVDRWFFRHCSSLTQPLLAKAKKPGLRESKTIFVSPDEAVTKITLRVSQLVPFD